MHRGEQRCAEVYRGAWRGAWRWVRSGDAWRCAKVCRGVHGDV